MELPPYLQKNASLILSQKKQNIALWTTKYDYFKKYEVVALLYSKFPNRNIQRDDVVYLLEIDLYICLVAIMIWGGIDTRPKKNNGNCNLEQFLLYPKEKAITSLELAKEKIKNGEIIDLFKSFDDNGNHKIPGVGRAYFTKVFFFLSELKGITTNIKPLIWDKWTSNAHCALLLESNSKIGYSGINKSENFLINIPSGNKRAQLYLEYIIDMSKWALILNTLPANLEAFVFGEHLGKNKTEDNPRIALWKIVALHFNVYKPEKKATSTLKVKPTKEQKTTSNKQFKKLSSSVSFYPLQEFLKNNSDEVNISIEEIKKILGRELPDWAYNYPGTFWCNSGHDFKNAWLSQGFIVQKKDINKASKSGSVTFKKMA